MIWKRRGGIISALVLVQAGIVACYHVAQSGNAAATHLPPALPRSEKSGAAAPGAAYGLPPAASPMPPPSFPGPDGTKFTAKVPPPAVVDDHFGGVAAAEPKEPTPAPNPPEKTSDLLPTPPPAPAPAVPTVGVEASPVAQPPLPDAPPPSPAPASAGDLVPQPANNGKLAQPLNAVAPAAPAVSPTPEAPAAGAAVMAAVGCPWILRVEIVHGRTQLVAETSKDVQFSLSCESLNLQAPRGSIEAKGAVKLSSPGIEGTCDHLTITWQDDHVILEGQAQMKCRRDGQDLELKSDRLSLRLSGARIDHSSPAEESEPPDAARPRSSRINRTKPAVRED